MKQENSFLRSITPARFKADGVINQSVNQSVRIPGINLTYNGVFSNYAR